MLLLLSLPAIAATALLSWYIATATWRFFRSSLNSVPGPIWAKISPVWLWIHDMKGSAPRVIQDLHRKYGPIVRIGPNEVSVNDVDVHNSVLYCQGPKFMKASYFYDPFLTGPPGVFQSTDQAEHAILRRLVSKPYSRKNVLEFEPQIHESVAELTQILQRLCSRGEVVDITKMLRCLSLDFITRFTYGESMHAVQTDGFKEDVLDAFDQFTVSNFMFMMFPSLRGPAIAFLSKIPSKVFQAVPKMRERVKRALEIHQHKSPIDEDGKPRSQHVEETSGPFRPLLMSEIETSKTLGHPLTKEFLIADGLADVFAGTDTTSTTLIITLYEIFSNDEIYARLSTEIEKTMPLASMTPSLVELEALPYLSACVKEGLRYSTPVRSRLPRVCPDPGWTFDGHVIPKGTIVSSSPYLMNYNEDVFTSARKFDPERWLASEEGDGDAAAAAAAARIKVLEDCWSPFSKGSRGCLGKNLALAEIYIAIATLVRRFRAARVLTQDLVFREVFGVIFDAPVKVEFAAVEG